jgi:hypothetical protein
MMKKAIVLIIGVILTFISLDYSFEMISAPNTILNILGSLLAGATIAFAIRSKLLTTFINNSKTKKQ